MNPDDDDAVINQLKYPRLPADYLPKLGLDFVRSVQNRSLQHHGKCIELQAFAEDELVRKEFKEVHCEMPGVPRSTFLMVFSPDGTKVASTHGNHNIYITDLRTSKNVKTLVGHPRTPWCIAFHPSYNDIIASGCLGGQVRIWDLAGGSEVWTAENETVIASIAFHPIDHMLVIATFNELHFWDWSNPKPFACIATANTKEKVRYVEFDRMGHKLITGITNVPQSRWDRTRTSAANRVERGRFPLTPPSPPDRTANYYQRRASTPRVVTTYNPYTYSQASTSSTAGGDRVPLSSVPERERRITACYQNLVHEYELLVHRYLQVYSPPTMMDRGTDPMEAMDIEQPTAGEPIVPDNSNTNCTSNSTVSTSSQSLSTPQSNDFRVRCGVFFSRLRNSREHSAVRNAAAASNAPTRRRLLLRTTSGVQTNNNEPSEPSTSSAPNPSNDPNCKVSFKMRIKCLPKHATRGHTSRDRRAGTRTEVPKQGPNTSINNYVGRSVWSSSQKRPHPCLIKIKKNNRKPILDTSSDNTSSDDTTTRKRIAVARLNEPSIPVSSANSTASSSNSYNPPHSVEEEICLPNFIARGTNSAPVCSACCSTPQETSVSTSGCARTSYVTQPSARTLGNTNTATTDSTVYTPSGGPRVSTRPGYIRFRHPTQRPGRIHLAYRRTYTPPRNVSSTSSAQDEVINYAERSNSEDDLVGQPASEFHPFDPPPEFPSINPENIGIGNMYSSIVQDLESSLNNVRNIRASNRPGETSDMLSSFSERLESIMQQSDSILHNLSQSMDILPIASEQAASSARRSSLGSPTSPAMGTFQTDSPNVLEDTVNRVLEHIERINDLGVMRNVPPERSPLDSDLPLSPTIVVQNSHARAYEDANFYIRDNRGSDRTLNPLATLDGTDPQDLYDNRSAIASDHSYHVDSPRILPQQTDNLTPLMTSLHLTISHIRRQARLLRRQVDSIERIDRAMLEVAQLQTIRQLFGELRRHLSNLSGEHRSTGVSSVRQMMAGTRISDSSPCNSGAEQEPSPPLQNNPAPANVEESQPPRQHSSTGRKQLPPSRLLHLQRQNRRFAIVNLLPRRYNTRNRYARQRLYLRSFAVRHRLSELPDHFSSTVTTNTLAGMIRRLELHLTAHISAIGLNTPSSSNSTANEIGEIVINDRLRLCRARMNRITNSNTSNETESTSNVTLEGVSRYTARNTLSQILETFTLFLSENRNNRYIPQSIHVQMRNVIDLTSLLSDILLLQIVDVIPPPSGMNLDPERESLSASIDEMCSRMLQRRIIGQSHTLNRSLRLMRLTARYATHALDQTYNARCNAIFSNGSSTRRELLGQIHSTLRSIQNRGISYYVPPDQPQGSTQESPPAPQPWYTPVHAFVSRISDSNSSGAAQDVSNSDDDNDSWYNNDQRQSLYRTTNVNLVNSEDPGPSTSHQNRLWSVPTVQINDVPISESLGLWQSRIFQHRYRLSDLRSNPMLSLFRPRYLHPLYAGGPLFDSSDLEDRRQDQLNEGEAIMTFTPNHRIQAWDVSTGEIPDISNSTKNIVVGECKIHNDASVDLSSDGTLLVTLLPSGGYLNVTNRLGVYSLRWESLGQMLYITSFEQNVVSVSLSPLSRHLVVGLASRRVSIIPNDKWTMARIFLLGPNDFPYGGRLPVLRELEQNRDTSYMSLNCIRWLPVSGQGLIIATNTGQLRILS